LHPISAIDPLCGNPDLQPEESETWDVGLDLDYQALFLSLGYFSTRYENMITYETVTGKPGFQPPYTGITMKTGPLLMALNWARPLTWESIWIWSSSLNPISTGPGCSNMKTATAGI
nr:TonB-dependent receptor [Desulfobacula sp.]